MILTMPLLEGLDGVQKMSKSLGNYIGLSESPVMAYGKLMSISDDLMWRYWLLLSGKSADEVTELRAHVAAGILHPLACKKMLAFTIVERFWSPAGAEEGQQSFEALFQQKDYSQAQELVLDAAAVTSVWIVELLKMASAIATSSEGRRLVESGAVMLDNEKITDAKAMVSVVDGVILKVGKHRIYRIILK